MGGGGGGGRGLTSDGKTAHVPLWPVCLQELANGTLPTEEDLDNLAPVEWPAAD